jgi:hypothetical protein
MGRCAYSMNCDEVPEPGFSNCATHRQARRDAERRRHRRYRRAGFCACGQVAEPDRKRCRKCLDYYAARGVEVIEDRVVAGLCPFCGKQPDGVSSTGRRYRSCARCRDRRTGLRRRLRKRAKRAGTLEMKPDPGNGARVEAVRKRWRALGRCRICGVPVDVTNPRTGEPATMCSHHLRLAADRRRKKRMKKGK